MNDIVLSELLPKLDLNIHSVRPIAGGDISKAYCLETNHDNYFLKVNQESFALDMFQKEKLALEKIAQYNMIKVPAVFQVGQIDGAAFLLMEFIRSSPIGSVNFKKFGIQLAEFHLQFENSFGWENDNYIGSLHQNNVKCSDWNDFYINQRIAPQIKTAIDKNLLYESDLPSSSKLFVACKRLFPDAKASPLHGDLWSGNYISNSEGEVFIIDPAFYFGHHEVDIAMSQLFGGFPKEFYSAYHSVIPIEPNYKERIQFLQLFYLLVHLNLFGKSYVGSVMSILNKYSN